MTKRERVLAAIAKQPVDAIPAGFSLHFPTEINSGEAAVKAHLDFFRETDTDMIKIMNENLTPDVGEIIAPEDWNKIPDYSLDDDFMQAQLKIISSILDSCDRSAYIVGTVHGICASAIHPIEARYGYEAVRDLFCSHLRSNKKPVLDAWGRIADGMAALARRQIEMGVDAIYYAALGGESRWFTDEEFAEYIEPFDRQILSAVHDAGGKTILHICKDGLNMQRYAGYADLVDVVNWGVYETHFSLDEGRKLFPNAAIMGGLANRSGVLVDGTTEELAETIHRVVKDFGTTGFILGADCTLATEQTYGSIRAAVDTAHQAVR